MPVSPRSNSSIHGDDAIVKVDSPSEKQIAELMAADESAIMDDESVDLDMADEEDDDEESKRPYKRVCRGRESALSLAMSDLTKKR